MMCKIFNIVCRKLIAKISLAFLFLIFLNSCIITRTPGFYSGYKRLPPEQKKKVVILTDSQSIPSSVDSNMYAITAEHLKQVMIERAPCIVYIWQPHCKGSVCISPLAFEQFCKRNNYNAIVVGQYFAFEMLEDQGINQGTVLAINHWKYGTDYVNKYLSRFQQSLFTLFGTPFNAKSFNKYMYYDGQNFSNQKPADLSDYPWR